MTLEDIKSETKEFLTANEIAPILNANPNSIRVQARDNPAMLGFPVVVILNRVKIPRRAFIKFVEGDSSSEDKCVSKETQILTMTPDEVCSELRKLGIRTSPTRVRTAIKDGQYPFGICIQMHRDEFEIYRTLFDKWVKERLK